jgi:ubiquinone/menaquinone biosynthesis C-methylase UbiE
MSNEHTSINEFDFNLIAEYFATVKRQGPGSPEITAKAAGFIGELNPESCIADVGCGTGGQTMVLAQQVPGQITGIDLFPKFIDLFNRNAAEAGLSHRLQGSVGSMESLPFKEEELDLIWSEGAIYFMGFEQGLREWRKFLKPGGFVAVSEASWFTKERPVEIEEFWQEAYPGIDTIPIKLAQMQDAGYMPVAAFILPEICWTKHFYDPQVEAQETFLKKHAGNQAAEDFIENQRHETRLYYRYKDYYGYAFYIGKKV